MSDIAYSNGYEDARSEVESIIMAQAIEYAKDLVRITSNASDAFFREAVGKYLSIVLLHDKIFPDGPRLKAYFDTTKMPIMLTNDHWANFLKE